MTKPFTPFTLRDLRRVATQACRHENGWHYGQPPSLRQGHGEGVSLQWCGAGFRYGGRSAYNAKPQLIVPPRIYEALPKRFALDWKDAAAILDRLIAEFGPDLVVEAPAASQARPKGTDEVALAGTDSDGALHGGDGASGEVDHPADKPGQPGEVSCSPGQSVGSAAEQSDGADSQEATVGQRSVGSDAPEASATGDKPGAASDSAAAGELSDQATPDPEAIAHRNAGGANGAGASTPSQTGEASLRPEERCGASTGAAPGADGNASEPSSAKELTRRADPAEMPPVEPVEGGCDDSSAPDCDWASLYDDEDVGKHKQERGSCRQHGGQHASIADYNVRALARTGRRAAGQMRRLMDRLFRAMAPSVAGDEPSPRIDGRRLVREMAAKRYALGRARRTEMAAKLRIVAVDVSGSCSVAAPETLAAGLALVEASPERTLLVVHSNGIPCEVRGGKGLALPAWEPNVAHGQNWADYEAAWWREVSLHAAAAMWFGDGDGIWGMQALDAVCPLLWLSDYGCVKEGVRPGKVQPDWGLRPWAYYAGVRSAENALVALRAIAAGIYRAPVSVRKPRPQREEN